VLASDRDFGDHGPYSGITTDSWESREGYTVFYASLRTLQWKSLYRIIQGLGPDVIYLNSMYSRYFTLYPLAMKRLGMLKSRFILSPRGMLKVSALSHKSYKKKLFLAASKILGLYRKVDFHATDKAEQHDVQHVFGQDARVFAIANLSLAQPAFGSLPNKEKGALSMIFVGRIHPVKNLHFLIACLQQVKAATELVIVGPVEDQAYWGRCRDLIGILPSWISVDHVDGAAHAQIVHMISESHLFALPTRGENFGHAIFEALSVGRPVLVSDQTPWTGLEAKGIGWDLPLDTTEAWANVINIIAEMDQGQWEKLCRQAWLFVDHYNKNSSVRDQYKSLFSA